MKKKENENIEKNMKKKMKILKMKLKILKDEKLKK